MTIPVTALPMPHGATAYLTGRDPDADDPAVGRAGNLSHRRPHVPPRLAADRAAVCERMEISRDGLYLMEQVHGAEVGWITDGTPPAAELRAVDALITTGPDRALAVQVADCVPVLLAGPSAVAAAHAGRRGLMAGILGRTLAGLGEAGSAAEQLTAALGPAIGGCCYEVPAELRAQVAAEHPVAAATTTWGTPALDLPRAVAAALREAGVATVRRHGSCTRCDPQRRWFSHRRDPGTGRQLGVVVRRRPS